MKKIFITSLLLLIYQIHADTDHNYNAQRTHRNIASKSSFRSKDILHDAHHRQYSPLNQFTSSFFARAIAQASASSHYTNHHLFNFLDNKNTDLTDNVTGFPVNGLLGNIIHMASTDNGRLFVVFNSTPDTIHTSTGTVFSSVATKSSGAIEQLFAGGGYLAALDNIDNTQVDVWSTDGTYLSTIHATGPVTDVTLNGENGGTLYIAVGHVVEKYLADGTFIDTLPKQTIFGNIAGTIGFLNTHNSGDVYLSNNQSLSNKIVDMIDSVTGLALKNISISLNAQNRKAISKDNRFFMLRDSGGSSGYINVLDCSNPNSPVEGLYIIGDKSPDPPLNDFAVNNSRLFAIARNISAFTTVIAAWNKLDPSTFPSPGGLLNFELDDGDTEYLINPNSNDEQFFALAAGNSYVAAYGRNLMTNIFFLRNYDVTNGSFNATFTLPAAGGGFVQHLVSSDDDKVFAADGAAIASWPSSGGALTYFSPSLPGPITKLVVEGSFIGALHSGNIIDVWSTSGMHLQTIIVPGPIQDFGINDNNGGLVYVAIAGTNVYEKYKISDGSQYGVLEPLVAPINRVSISSEIGIGNPLLYILSGNNQKIDAIFSDGNKLGNASTPGVVQDIVSMQVGPTDLLYLAYGNSIAFINGGTSGDLSTPFATKNTPDTILHLAVTTNGNVFAGNSSRVDGWSTDGITTATLTGHPLNLSGIVQLMVAHTSLYVLHKANILET